VLLNSEAEVDYVLRQLPGIIGKLRANAGSRRGWLKRTCLEPVPG
jgi:hypothetical protein